MSTRSTSGDSPSQVSGKLNGVSIHQDKNEIARAQADTEDPSARHVLGSFHLGDRSQSTNVPSSKDAVILGMLREENGSITMLTQVMGLLTLGPVASHQKQPPSLGYGWKPMSARPWT